MMMRCDGRNVCPIQKPGDAICKKTGSLAAVRKLTWRNQSLSSAHCRGGKELTEKVKSFGRVQLWRFASTSFGSFEGVFWGVSHFRIKERELKESTRKFWRIGQEARLRAKAGRGRGNLRREKFALSKTFVFIVYFFKLERIVRMHASLKEEDSKSLS